ncbi:ribonuclease E/G [uncultured Croceicoccus sp.]|uniref:ribonuclease E/G n=1 Tax=uncultured Croceicoccus sp. TaxID=1295329 RepID=UPI002635EDF4|nr:ribonuclease E/G [uncultured Croceicoccus sp.]
MTTRMLIDARHQEETRVAVLKGNRIEEFDFESSDHKQIKGNIYLAKVTRVEPSLQAAFVDFGGNRHGFLAFSEIHPDYYQIPKQDRDALLAEEQEHAEEEARLRSDDDDDSGDDGHDHDDRDDDESSDALADEMAGDGLTEVDTSEKDDVATIEDGAVEGGSDDDGDDEGDNRRPRRARGKGRRQGGGKARAADEARAKRLALRRRYKIQDVIQRRQVLLVQVVKEERGNKGAALTTYLSLAGRYCVLMPNSSHGGGISRKISSAADRKRLKQIVSEMNLPRSMGCIVRTAGLSRTKTEIKRDFDYLARLWDEIRERTMQASAPAPIHSDSDLVKRAIRDIYNREIEEVVVEGPEGYKAAKQFMKLLMPSHARRVKQYADPVPLFQRYGAEDQLTAMYDPVVQLKSGGYLVINPTEALVSIDINSGRSTKEHGIEQTALATNLEAAKEIARQLRLRDMAGLVVIDFIDMENNSSIRKVEKCMKDSLKNDRARIQVGRISGFGLMEMSRQRLRTGVLEATTRECPHCDGTGLVRTASSAGLSALRMIEDEAAKGKGSTISLYASTEAAVYLLNSKRADLAEIEERYGVMVEVLPEGENEGAKMRASSSGPKPTFAPKFEPIQDDILDADDVEDDEDEEEEETGAETETQRDDDRSDDDKGDDERGEDDNGSRRKRRRRRRGGRRNRGNRNGDESRDAQDDGDSDDASDRDGDTDGDTDHGAATQHGGADEDKPRKRRRRRRKSDDQSEGGNAEAADAVNGQDETRAPRTPAPEAPASETSTDDAPASDGLAEDSTPDAEQEKPKAKSRRSPRRKKTEVSASGTADESAAETAADDAPKPKKPRRPRKKKADAAPDAGEPDQASSSTADDAATKAQPAEREEAPAPAPAASEAAPAEPKAEEGKDETESTSQEPPRRGWWQRTFG